MSIPTLVILILNVLLAIFLLYGFLWGIGRGLKKSAIRFAYFIGFVIIAAIASPFVSSALAGITIPGLGSSLEQFLLEKIQDIPEISQMVASSEAMGDLIAKLPILFINIIVFVVLVYISRIFSWIGYTITTKIHLKKKKPVGKFGDKKYTVKDGQPVVLTEVKEKKNRLLGGLIGAVQGLILLFLTLLPLTGIVGMAGSYINQTVSAQSNNTVNAVVSEPEYTELAKLLRQNLPAEAVEVIDAYSSSIVVKVFSVGEFDLKCFDSLTTINIGGQKVTLRNEVKTVGEVVESAIYIMNFAEQMQNAESELNWEDLDFNKMKKAVNAMFDSGFVRSVGMDALNYYLNYATVGNPFDLPDEAIQMLQAIKTSLAGEIDTQTADILKSDILALLGMAQAVFESGLVDLLQSDEEPTPVQIIACLKGADNQYKTVSDFFDSLFNSKTLKAALCEGVNIGTSELAKVITEKITEENEGVAPSQAVVFSQIQPNLVSWTNVKNEIQTSIIKGIEIYEIVGDINFDTANETTILGLEYEKVITNVGTILNNLKNTSILKGTESENSVLDELFANLNRIEEIGTYFDLTKLSDVDFEEEFDPIVGLINIFKPAIISETTYDYSILNYTTISTTIQTLLNSTFLEAIKTTIFDKVLESGIDGDMAGTAEKIITNLKTDYDNLSEASAELMNFVNIACVLGESGVFNLINDNSESNISAVLNSLKVKKSDQTETQIARVISYLFNSESTRILFVDAINQSLASMEEIDNEMGRINKDQDWATFSADLKEIIGYLINIYDYLGGYDNFNFLWSEPTTILDNSNFADIMTKLGEILDKFATSGLLEYEATVENPAGNIYDNLLDKFFSGELANYININDAKTLNYDTDFWKTQLGYIASAVKKMGAENFNTILESLINGENFDSVIGELNASDTETILEMLLDCSLFKGIAVDFVNMVNEQIIGIVQEDTSTVDAPATLGTDLKSQKDQIIAVFNALLPIMDFTGESDLTLPENEAVVTAFLTALKASYDNTTVTTGVFADAYTAINNKIIDVINQLNNSLFDVIGSAPAEILVPAETDTTQIFSQFVTVVNALSPLETATSIADMFNYYQSSFLALLNILQTNANAENGIFGDAYGAIESYILNDAGELSNDIADVLNGGSYYNEGLYDWDGIFDALGD
ncbi:MAG: hypothetical protein PHQ62_03420 [Clostridia bacterium]|nr:hypothetical protein [Clostridia bacterium]